MIQNIIISSSAPENDSNGAKFSDYVAFYNGKSAHSKLGHSPLEYERIFWNKTVNKLSGFCETLQVTLRQGFEVMLKRVATEIEEIVDTTNHASGKQPFYPHHE